MLIEVGIENFRSIKDRIELSLIADSGNSKKDNLSEVILPNEKSIRLLNTLAIYGANASGKSNVIRGLFSLVWFIKTSGQLTAEKGIPYYDPFLFDTKIGDHPTIFCITFLLEEIKYRYQVSYNSQAVLHEQLDYYPKGQKQNLFTRSFTPDTIQQVGRLSNQFNYKEFELFSNQLFLSKFGRDIPNEIISKVYLYFTKLEIWNACSTIKLNQLQKNMKLYYKDPHNSLLLKKLNNLIRSADTMIRSIKIESVPDKGQDESNKNDDSVPNLDIRSYHDLFEGEKHIGFRDISFENESVGTNALLAFGGLVLIALEFGGVVMIDEIHNSLHPKLSSFLIGLFNNPISNPRNAQLVFTTHDITLLKSIGFRKDQLWFTEKNKYGTTDLFCASDFEGLRDDASFENWYRTGKFGATPNIKEINFLYDNE